jgi:hypothetical protein
VKHSLLLPLRFILRTVFYCSIGTVFLFVHNISRFSPVRPPVRFLVSRILFHGGEIFFTALLLALVVSLFSIIRRPGIKVLTFGLLFTVALLFLYSGMLGLGRLKKLGTLPDPTQMPFKADLLYLTREGAFWIGGSEGPVIKTVLVQGERKGGTIFRVYPEGIYKSDTETLRLLPGGLEFPTGLVRAVPVPEFFSVFLQDMNFSAKAASPRDLPDFAVLLFCGSLVFYCVSLWTLVRLTRWPLFNGWIAFAALWAMPAALRFWGEIFLPEVLMLSGGGPWIAYVPALIPGLCGGVLLLACLLMRPLHEWKRDVDYD